MKLEAAAKPPILLILPTGSAQEPKPLVSDVSDRRSFVVEVAIQAIK